MTLRLEKRAEQESALFRLEKDNDPGIFQPWLNYVNSMLNRQIDV